MLLELVDTGTFLILRNCLLEQIRTKISTTFVKLDDWCAHRLRNICTIL